MCVTCVFWFRFKNSPVSIACDTKPAKVCCGGGKSSITWRCRADCFVSHLPIFGPETRGAERYLALFSTNCYSRCRMCLRHSDHVHSQRILKPVMALLHLASLQLVPEEAGCFARSFSRVGCVCIWCLPRTTFPVIISLIGSGSNTPMRSPPPPTNPVLEIQLFSENRPTGGTPNPSHLVPDQTALKTKPPARGRTQ
jgi:hypothetical protein